MTTFKELGLNSEIMKSLEDLGFEKPSPIQEKSIPFILKSKQDLIALAQTGTGKTAAFSLPILNQLKKGEKKLLSIVVCPTRELCLQISDDIRKFAKHSKGVKVASVYGGERIDFQIRTLKRGVNIVVGTPGRVHDLIRRKVLNLGSVKWLVLDEADEMLDMGFKEDLDAVLEQVPETKQTLLFSATMSKSVYSIARKYMDDIKEISAGEKNIGADKVTHEYYVAGARDRFEALQRIIDSLPGVYGILFCRTKNETQVVADKLKQANYSTDAIHGDISQAMRTKIMDRFKRKQIRLLVATDVAARGIDVSDLTHVINYNLPDQNEAYTHRSGRTGRADKSGVAITIVTPREAVAIKRLEKIIGKEFELKKIPTGKDVSQIQINNFIEEIEGMDVEKIGDEQNFDDFIERLKKIKKEDLIKLFISNKFSHLMSGYKNARDLNAVVKTRAGGERRDDEKMQGLKINLGKKQGMDVKGVFALINSSKLKGIDVGKISLTGEYSIFSVDKNKADEVIKRLKGTNFRGKRIEISKSNQVTSYQGGGRKRGGRGRGFRKKRGGFRKSGRARQNS